jgi:TetR/AcrR family transcriptional regulator
MSSQSSEENRSNRIKLLHAAIDAFAESGYDGASLRAIAENAGVAFQLISYYFGSKDALWKAALEHQYERYLETGKGLGFTLSGNIFEQFRNHLRLLLTDLLQRPQLRKIWVQESLAGSTRYSNFIQPQIKNLYENLALPYYTELVRLGIVKRYSPQEIGLIVASASQMHLTYAYYAELCLGRPTGSTQSIEEQVDLLFRVLTAGSLEEADEIDASARARVTTPYQDRLSRIEADIEQLKKLVVDRG